MKTKMFEEGELTPEEIISNLEAECLEVQEGFSFLRPYTDEEIEQVKTKYADTGIELNILEEKLKAVTEPIKAAIKPIKETNLILRNNLAEGGERITGRVYLFADYENNVMALYDERGILVSTRPLKRKERQLHINSFKSVANGD